MGGHKSTSVERRQLLHQTPGAVAVALTLGHDGPPVQMRLIVRFQVSQSPQVQIRFIQLACVRRHPRIGRITCNEVDLIDMARGNRKTDRRDGDEYGGQC